MILNAATAADIEKQAEMLKNIGIGLGVLAGVFLVLSIILFIKLEIKRVIGEKTGRVERKSIEQLEHEATLSGKLQMNRSGKKVKKGNTSQMKVQDIFTNLENEVVNPDPTGGVDTTEPLKSSEIPAQHYEEETSVLNSGYGETSVLENTGSILQAANHNVPHGNVTSEKPLGDVGKFVIVRDITLIHTNEYI